MSDKSLERARLLKNIKARRNLYLLLIFPIVYVFVFSYIPMGGLVMDFKRYNFLQGVFGSPWVGLDNFRRFFRSYQFTRVLRNTLVISFYGLATFPIPIIFALFLNTLPYKRYQKIIQTVTYMPYFISTVVMVGIIFQVLNNRTGLYGTLMLFLSGSIPPDIFTAGVNFTHIYVWSGVWQGTGYSSIIYFAALAHVDMELHEAALVDGATRFQRVLHIDLPSILPTVGILLILSTGGIMSVGFEKVFLMQNSLNLSYSEVISTYVYKIGLASGVNDFSLATAIGMFNSVINFMLLLTTNWISKKLSGSGIF
jgi:ABC-type polysaccharide transport system permease subunit